MRLFLAFLITSLPAYAQDVLIHRLRFSGPSTGGRHAMIEFRVDEAGLRAFGGWEPAGNKPPGVTRNEAVKLAWQALGLAPGDEPGQVLASLERANLHEVGKDAVPPGCSPWFYLIEIPPRSSKAESRYVLVTVGGIVAKATRTVRRR